MLSSSKQTQTKNPGSRVGPDPTAKTAESPPSGSDSYTDDESGTESDSDEESTGTMRQETLNDVCNHPVFSFFLKCTTRDSIVQK
jgi:hypothetical protein